MHGTERRAHTLRAARSAGTRRRLRMPSWVAASLALLMGVSAAIVPSTAAHALDPAALRNTKSASASDVVPGQSFNWVIEVGCSVLTDECVNAVLADTIPSEFVIADASTVLVTGAIATNERTITVVGQELRIAFTEALASPSGASGLRNGIVTVTVPVTVRSDLDYTPTPRVVSNTSHMTADNAPPIDSTASVNLTVPLQLATTPTKSFAPATNPASAGVPTTLSLGGTNTSNSAVDTLIVQDPVDPSAIPNIFANTLVLQSPLSTVTWPSGATDATVELWDASLSTPGWVAAAPVAAGGTLIYPAAVALANVRGVRITFTSGGSAAIIRNTSVGFSLDVVNRSGVAPGISTNVANSTVALGVNSTTATVSKTYTLTAASTSVAATKTIVPNRLSTVTYGARDLTSAVVKLTGKNTGNLSLKSLTVSEPTDPTGFNDPANPLSPAHLGGGLIFAGFGTVTWPAGATAASITYHYADGTTATLATATANTIPASPGVTRVTGFAIAFTGIMVQSTIATIPFTVDTNPLQVAPDLAVVYSNTVRVDGTSVFDDVAPPATASASATVFADQLSITTSKVNWTPTLLAIPGQSTTTTLTSTITDYPETTRAVNTLEIVDPKTETGLTDWYKYFDPRGLVATQVPGGATLTVQYRDALGVYGDIPGFVGLGPGSYTQAFPAGLLDSIYGVKLTWTSSTGFTPGSSLTANLTYALRSALRGTTDPLPNTDLIGVLENCSASNATTMALGGLSSNRAESPFCPKVDLKGTGGGGGGGGTGTADLLTKEFISTANTNPQDIITTRNSNRTRVRLTWSTAGFTNVNQMEIYDGPVDSAGAPDPANYVKGMFDAFNLQAIPAINAALDPLMQYDRVAIQLFNSATSVWETPGGWACSTTTPCQGSTTARTLTAAEQNRYIAVRFLYSERTVPTRSGFSPAPGSGVASSFAQNRRVDLIFELRNSLRSDSTVPVVSGYQYNVPVTIPGVSSVFNGSHALATLTGFTITDAASDTIALQDPNLAVNVTKTWAGGSLAIPDSTVVDPRPTGRVTIVATNQTPGIVNSLRVQEPTTGVATPNDSPFEQFNLARFVSFASPIGATGMSITVVRTAGGNLTASGTPAAVAATAIGWNAATLADTTSVEIIYTGAIAATTGKATVVFDLELRTTLRSNPSTAVSPGTVFNSTQAVVGDPRFDATSAPTSPTFINTTLAARAGASKVLVSSSISVTAGKTFTPSTQTEPVRVPVTMALSATPGGSERVKSVVLTDDRASFWNTFDLQGLAASFVLPVFSPLPTGSGTTIQTDACVGRTWDAAALAVTPSASCTATGGTWVIGLAKTQAQALAGFLPTGVAASSVQGLRFTVSRADGSQWENPEAPTITVPLTVQRRLTLRTGGDVLTDYPTNSAAPGETNRGVTTNTVTTDILGIWGKQASAAQTSIYTYKFAPTSVEVLKTPSGAKAPGQVFNYALRVRNTGSWPIVNPVITDYLPVDANGAMLVFDPDAALPPTFTYALSGAAPIPVNGAALPTGNAGATVVQLTNGQGPEKLTFTFPSSLAGPPVLEVGQTYTITIPMMFRAGLAYSVPVTNRFGIRGDRQFDGCTAPAGSTASLDGGTGECTTATTVLPAQQPALRAFASVKAIVDLPNFPDQGFTGGTPAQCTAAQDAAGFSRLPCIPLTLPGQREIWRLTAQNTGTTELPRVVLATRLPAVGDTTILDGFLRKSAWRAGFSNGILATLGIPGATVAQYYSTSATPCTLVLETPSNLGACGSDPTTGWALLTGTVDPTTIESLQFVVDFPSSHYLRPGESLQIDIPTVTAALSATPGANTTANNSLSASAISITGVTQTRVTALDYGRVSVGLVTGSVRLQKSITGTAASFIPAGQTFVGQLECTSLGETTTRPFTFTFTGTVTTPAFIQFDDLPGGASCTATETTASGQSTYTSTTVIVDPQAVGASLPQVQLVNDYQLASLVVTKTVTSTATTIPTGFGFTVLCTFLGEALALGADASFTLDAGTSATITGLPANASCTVVEVDKKGAESTVVTGSTGASGSLSIDQTTRTSVFTLSPDTLAGAPTNSTNFDNRYGAAAVLVLQKSFEGDAAAQFGETQTSFTAHVTCTFGSTTPAQYDGDVALLKSAGWVATLTGIVAGSACTITETDLQGADAVVITPNDGTDLRTGRVIVPGTASPVVAIDVTNWFLTGSIEVTKVFAGDAGAIDKFGKDPAVSFEFTLACLRGGVHVIIPLGNARIVTALSPVASYGGLPSGARCTLTETATGGATSSRVTDSLGNTIVGGTFIVAVTVPTDLTALDAGDQPQAPLQVANTFLFAEVSATKTVSGPTPTSVERFQLTIGCALDGRTILPQEPTSRRLSAGETVTWTQLAAGASCTVTETDARGATKTDTLVTAAALGAQPIRTPGISASLPPLRPVGSGPANHVEFINLYTLAYTGRPLESSLVLVPFGLILVGGVLVTTAYARRRVRR